MSSSTAPVLNLQGLLDKLSNPDSDYRFMTLNDLLSYLSSPTITLASQEVFQNQRLIDGVIKALDDPNGEVQNLAVKCVGPLVSKLKDNSMDHILRKLTKLCLETNSDLSIRSTALRNVIVSLPRPNVAVIPTTAGSIGPSMQGSANAIVNIVIPELYAMLDPSTVVVDAVDVLIDTLRCFGTVLAPKDVEKLQVHVMNILENDRTSGVVKKRSVNALSLLCVYSPDILLSSFVSHLIETLTVTSQTPQRLKLLVSVTGALANGIPQRFAPYLATLCPLILSIVSSRHVEEDADSYEPNAEEDEVKEAALVALEAFQSNCTTEMRKFTADVINAGLAYIKYDPNFADQGDDDDEDMGGTQDDSDEEAFDDDDFEEDANFSDEDDFSWKVRRCAAKLITTVINTRARDLLEDGTLYSRLAPVLIDRFNEREESVRLEILGTTTTLIRRTGELASTYSSSQPSSKKRRRVSDDTASEVTDSNPEKSLAKLVPRLAKAIAKLLKTKTTTLSTKQQAVGLLSALATALHGGLADVMSLFIEPIIDLAQGGTSFTAGGGSVSMPTAVSISSVSATGGSLRIEVLRLIGKLAREHSLDGLRPYLANLVKALDLAIKERFYKISSEALGTATEVIVLLSQDGSQDTEEQSKLIKVLHAVIMEKVKAADTDLEVREKAVTALGVLLSRTTTQGTGVNIAPADRKEGLDIILQRLKNETTRVVSVRAIDTIVKGAKSASDLNAEWVKAVVVELGGQLRKSNRVLRSVSLEALKSIAENSVSRADLDLETRIDIMRVVVPLLNAEEIHLLGAALVISRIVIEANDVQIDQSIIAAVCKLVRSSLGSGVVVNHLVAFIKAVGELSGPAGAAGKKALMKALIQEVGIDGDTAVVAKAIAQLLVSGGNIYDVKLDDFCKTATAVADSRQKCLALMVLGESGLRMKSSFPVGPDVFIGQFKSGSDDVPVAAAVALGLAAVGNLEQYLPVIMKKLGGNDRDKYLLLHTLKEIIQHSGDKPESIRPYAKEIWDALFQVSRNDDAKAVGAECLGRLTVIDPQVFLDDLFNHLNSTDSFTRGLVISAFRFTFSDTPASYDDLLRPIVVTFLTKMIEDDQIENRRLALTALNSAAHNKPHLVLPHLGNLLPLVYRESRVRPELVREVQMGPFKHKVDDGLEVRKSAYETLYALLDTSLPAIPIQQFYDRVIAGLEDDHDIRVLCNLMLPKLIQLAHRETLVRLESIGEKFRATLSHKPKDNAVKQELEKNAELIRSTLKASAHIQKELGSEAGKGWQAYWEYISQSFSADLKAIDSEDTGAGVGAFRG